MLEPKFAIYYRAASLSSQASSVDFLEAGACLSWSLPSITEQQVCLHRLPQ